MANSGTVTAGSAALASQYNNLRDDVLNVSTGHTHTGASENGAKVAATGVSSGTAALNAVLTADGSGGAAFLSAGASGGAFTAGTFVSGTASTFANGTADYASGYAFGANTGSIRTGGVVVTGGGTVLIGIGNVSSSSGGAGTTSRSIGAFNLDTTGTAGTAVTSINTTTISTTGGSAGFWQSYGGYGFAATGDGWAVIERINPTTGNHKHSLRKFTTTATNNWNTVIKEGGSAALDSVGYGPFHSGVRYNAGNGIWYGGDYVDTAMSTVTALSTAAVYVVNDSSGTVYSAPLGTAVEMQVALPVHVPAIGTAVTGGTIYAMVRQLTASSTALRIMSFNVSGTSVAVAGTANTYPDYTSAFGEEPIHTQWDSTNAKIIVLTQNTIQYWDRTFTTRTHLASVPSKFFDFFSLTITGSGINRDNIFDPATGLISGSRGAAYPGVWRIGSKPSNLNGAFSEYGITYLQWVNYNFSGYGSNAGVVLCGPGSPTFYAVQATYLSAPYDHIQKFWSAPIAGDASITVLGTAASGTAPRLAIVTFGGAASNLLSYDCADATPLTVTTYGTAAGYTTNTFSMIVPATSTLKINASSSFAVKTGANGNTTATTFSAKADVIQLA